MSKELEIKQAKVDWKKIIDLALKKKDWGKNYCLYKHGEVEINCVMESFNFVENKAIFKITIKYVFEGETYGHTDWYNDIKLNYKMSNFTIDEFIGLMHRRVKALISDVITRRTNVKAEALYNELWYSPYRIDTEKEATKLNLTANYETIKEIKDEDIRQDMLQGLDRSLARILNTEYHKLVHNYQNNNVVVIPYTKEIVEAINNE